MHFRRHQYVQNRSLNVSTNFGDDRSNNREKWQQFFEIEDGGSRHLEKYTSG